MPFDYYARLSPAHKRIYRQSDAIIALGLPRECELGGIVAEIRVGLATDRRPLIQRACQRLCDTLTEGYKVPPVRVIVLERRPSDDYGELHGLYEPEEGRRRARITVWMRTAAKQQVVAFRSFLRTVVHELLHHLDYELFALEETFHTDGFYKRESSLANALFAQEEAAIGRVTGEGRVG
ncbi:MAG TPA: hypothetical protein VNG69_16795 [Casimicrobiaceae bacterium]|nr:hypothetical protein [Casimicrobiaceae bacterium]